MYIKLESQRFDCDTSSVQQTMNMSIYNHYHSISEYSYGEKCLLALTLGWRYKYRVHINSLSRDSRRTLYVVS